MNLLLTPAFPCTLLDSSVSTVLCWQQRREVRKHSNLLGSEKHCFYSPHCPQLFSLLKSEFILSNDGWVPAWSFLQNAQCKLCSPSFPLCDCLPITCIPVFSGLSISASKTVCPLFLYPGDEAATFCLSPNLELCLIVHYVYVNACQSPRSWQGPIRHWAICKLPLNNPW